MRVFGIEISWSPWRDRHDGVVWYRNSRNSPRRLGDMTPEELRQELALVHINIRKGNTFRMTEDGHQLIHITEKR